MVILCLYFVRTCCVVYKLRKTFSPDALWVRCSAFERFAACRVHSMCVWANQNNHVLSNAYCNAVETCRQPCWHCSLSKRTPNIDYNLLSWITATKKAILPKAIRPDANWRRIQTLSHFSHHIHARSHETSIVVASSFTITRILYLRTFDRESLLWFGSRAHIAHLRLPGLGCRNCN